MVDIDKKYEKNRRLSLYKRQKKMYNKMVCVLCCKKDGGKTKEESPQTLNEGSSSKTSALPKIDPISQFRTF